MTQPPLPIPNIVADRAGKPIPLDGQPGARFLTASGTLVAVGYRRVAVGGRGAYVEFNGEQIIIAAFQVPADQQWRMKSENAFYVEYRSRDEANVMLYHQRRLVDYADYQIGAYYIAPGDLLSAPAIGSG